MLQVQNQGLRPLTTAHLAQTMTLLGMTAIELSQKIESDLANNPALELLEERRCPTCRRLLRDPGPCPICSTPKNANPEEPIVFISTHDDFYGNNRNESSTTSELTNDHLVAASEDLATFVLRQIAPELGESDRPIAAHILTSLDDDGLLSINPFDISRYHHVPLSQVEDVIRQIQRAEPIGVGSSSTKEALLVQLEVLSETQQVPELAERAIREGMGYLSRHQYTELANLLGLQTPEAGKIAQFIGGNLNPYPGRAHWGDIHQGNGDQPPVYHHPDIIIRRLNSRADSPLVVEIFVPIRGTLRINPLFRKSIQQAPEDAIEKWKQDLEQANLLIKCIQQRNHTLKRLMTHLSIWQRNFILRGARHLKPTTRASIAKILDVHESTISRAVSGKTVELPNKRIVPLELFFDRSLHIRTALCQLIDNEKIPLTDTQLVTLLAQQGYYIARRTVAKYRSMEGILPAHLRRNPSKTEE
jgi:RNA polymerase sigma-54 factor